MSNTSGVRYNIGKDARGSIYSAHPVLPSSLCLLFPFLSILNIFLYFLSDLLYKDYVHELPIRFESKDFNWISDISCKVNLIAPGLSTLFSFNVPDYGQMELQYENGVAEIAGGIGLKRNPLKMCEPVALFSAVIGGSSVCSIGTDLAFDISAGALAKFSAGFSLNSDFVSASLSLDKLDTVKASCFTMVNPLSNTALGAELKHRFSTNDSALAVGAQHAFFPSTLAKARVSTHGNVGVLIRQGFWQKLFLSMSGEVDFMGVQRSPRFGLSLSVRL
ncbi:mitochondrial outer membrane protein porin 1-like isoform X1 [Malus sylvestris]|uniref:mitochondrial outer membrane protein porin 1-like isoform X1 n=1 Tax=Malus sylvestris TaxID=3752 RepID=UPI0010AAEAED|nr:mitochondrial outer membrane protein porin 1-like isoform X1 [Malus domestica]XP_050123613.1 mitochondrial outer membrane protein porin 1-like isoform X1 [Malus sylvestris]